MDDEATAILEDPVPVTVGTGEDDVDTELSEDLPDPGDLGARYGCCPGLDWVLVEYVDEPVDEPVEPPPDPHEQWRREAWHEGHMQAVEDWYTDKPDWSRNLPSDHLPSERWNIHHRYAIIRSLFLEGIRDNVVPSRVGEDILRELWLIHEGPKRDRELAIEYYEGYVWGLHETGWWVPTQWEHYEHGYCPLTEYDDESDENRAKGDHYYVWWPMRVTIPEHWAGNVAGPVTYPECPIDHLRKCQILYLLEQHITTLREQEEVNTA